MDEPRTSRCRAGTETHRCSFTGTRDELVDHADEMGHPRCVVCAGTLSWHEQQTCSRCVARVRDDLDAVAVAYAHLERVIWQTAYRTGRLPGGDALVYVTDGSTQRPMHGYETAEPQRHPLARVDELPPPKIRDEWPSDPLSVLAMLEANERDWRHEFGHGPAVDLATVGGCLRYLRDWHLLAARTHPGFDDYATELRDMRSRLEHVVGLADDPVRAPAQCFDCTGQLVRTYTDRGLADDWTCRGCGRVYDQPSYFLALRAMPSDCQGWVPVKIAAAALRVPESTLFRWAARGEVETVRENGRTCVEWSEVSAKRERRAS